MRQGRRLGAGALAAAIGISLAGAPGLAAAAEEKPGSVHLQCDGSPASENLGSLLGSLVVITMTVGLAGSSELPDDSKQLKGDLGADACDAAIAKDGDEGRRAQLKLAKAIHRIEASRYEDALTEARGLAGVAPKLSAEKRFQVSMALSALEIEGAAQARMGRTAEASELGLRMFEAAPYDPVTVLRAARLIELSPAMTPRHLAFWEQAGRINPTMLLQRAAVDEWVGDFASAAEDVEALLAVIDGFVDDPSIPGVPPTTLRPRCTECWPATSPARSAPPRRPARPSTTRSPTTRAPTRPRGGRSSSTCRRSASSSSRASRTRPGRPSPGAVGGWPLRPLSLPS